MVHPIIKAVMREHLVGAQDFFGGCRIRRFTLARRAAAVRLSQTGLSRGVIARLMRREKTTIAYYINKEWRTKRKAAFSAYYHKQKAMEIRA